MSDAPWWVLSPSPMTLAFYSVLAVYGAHKLGSHGLREWVGNFAESALLIGLVILPFDSAWQILQVAKWGYLYPTESFLVYGILIRNLAILSLCLLSSWKLMERTGLFRMKYAMFVVIPILSLLVRFLFVNDIGWTDWTYILRFEDQVPWFLAYLTGMPDKATLGLVFVSLWRRNFLSTM